MKKNPEVGCTCTANSVQKIRKWRAYCDPSTTTVFISNDCHPPSDHHGSNSSYNSQVLWRKHPVLGIKLNPLSLLFRLARYHHNDTNKRLQNNDFRTLRRNHMFSSSFVHYEHEGVMARARILLITPRTTRGFRIFETST